MQIVVGRTYKNRMGDKVECIDIREGSTFYPFRVQNLNTNEKYYVTPDGYYWGEASPCTLDLVEEAFPEPNTTPIDQVTFGQLQRGVERLWKIGRIW